jgi:Ribbon-helix-helix protein, copG family
MRRTQLYLHEDTWETLHVQSRQRGASISELVRRAVREKYGRSPASRREAMQALVGMWKDRKDLRDSGAYVRRLRRGKRLKRLAR